MREPARFVADIFIPDMLYAVTIRSPVAGGALSAIDCPVLPDSCCLITAEHIPGKNELADFPVPVLADKNLSYIGQPVAILAGPDESMLEELASQIKVYAEEDLPFPGEIIVKREIVCGEPDDVFKKCEYIVEGTYTTGIQEHWYAEPHGAVAAFTSSPPSLTVYTATQWPYHVKRSVGQVLGQEGLSLIVSPTQAAVHLDGKIWYPSLVACHAALAACITGKPVKLMLTGEEDFLYSPKRNRAEMEIHSALGGKGEILASELRLTLNLGAHGMFREEIIDHSCLGAMGLYHHPVFRIEGTGKRDNIPAQGPMAGFGLAQGFFAAERHASRIADALRQDPAEWRKNNFLKEKQKLAIGSGPKNPIPSLPRLIDTVAASSDYYRKWTSYELLKMSRRGKSRDFTEEPLRGIGITTAFQGNGFLHTGEDGNGYCTVETRLEMDGSLEIKNSLAGSGVSDIWRNLAQEILGVDGGSVRVVNTTQDAPDSGIATLSRNISVVTKLVEKCCMAIRNQRFRRPLPITVKRSAKSAKEPGWGGMGKTIESEAFANPGWGAAVVEAEIDPVSLSPLVRGIWLAADGGKILSPRRARNTLRTGIIQALGWASREQVFYEKGKIPIELYRAYDIIKPVNVPVIHVDFIRNDTAEPRGIGDLPFCCVPAAYVQALSQAMDHHFLKIPLDTRDILELVKQKQQRASP